MLLDHVQLAMPPGGETQAIRFFVELLGMAEVEKPEPLRSRGGCWFCSGSTQLHIGVEPGFSPQRKAHPAFCVTDLDSLAAKLAAANIEVTWDSALPDRKRFYTADPFDNRLEFIQFGDGFSQR